MGPQFSQRVMVAPPTTWTFLSLRSWKKPIHYPSGEKKGNKGPSDLELVHEAHVDLRRGAGDKGQAGAVAGDGDIRVARQLRERGGEAAHGSRPRLGGAEPQPRGEAGSEHEQGGDRPGEPLARFGSGASRMAPLRCKARVVVESASLLRTELLEFNREAPEPALAARAAEAIRQGQVVAFPTDALYVLAADPYNLHAVGRVFQAKRRQIHRSLPLLVDSLLMAEDLATNLSSRFYLLARHFWPGPLTLIVPASAKVPLKVTGNTGRLAVRQTRAPIADRILRNLEMPIIATSANISGQPTCQAGIEVFGLMDGRVDLILDGGEARGPGATTVDITEPYWRIIREGAIGEAEIAECLKG